MDLLTLFELGLLLENLWDALLDGAMRCLSVRLVEDWNPTQSRLSRSPPGILPRRNTCSFVDALF